MTEYNNFFIEQLESMYKRAEQNGDIIYYGAPFLEKNQTNEELDSFHYKNALVVKKNDEYMCGIRADTFVVSVGYTEWQPERVCILVQANHKGHIQLTAFYAKDVNNCDIQFASLPTEIS